MMADLARGEKPRLATAEQHDAVIFAALARSPHDGQARGGNDVEFFARFHRPVAVGRLWSRIALPLDGIEQRLQGFVIHQRFFLGADEGAGAMFGAGFQMKGFDQQKAIAVFGVGHCSVS